MDNELLKFDLPKGNSNIIKVIGVGGSGGNATNYMYEKGITGVDFVICNTDQQALDNSPVPTKIQLGAVLTEGLGAGNNPERGCEAARESLDQISEMLQCNTKMAFITTGLGGGTGTGAAPVIAQQAKELGILTIGIVTLPYRFEGSKRKNNAIAGLKKMRESVDALLIIDNEKIREMYGNCPASKAFGFANDILTLAAKGIAEIITVHGLINVDFADVKAVMSDSGCALMGSATASGENRAQIAVKEALNCPLLSSNDITGAKNVLINIISSHEHEVSMDEVCLINDYVQEASGNGADIIWGNTYDDSLGETINITVIATGFNDNSMNDFMPTPAPQRTSVTLNTEITNMQQTQAVHIENTQTQTTETPTNTYGFNTSFPQNSPKNIEVLQLNDSQEQQSEEWTLFSNVHTKSQTLEYTTEEELTRLEEEPAYIRAERLAYEQQIHGKIQQPQAPVSQQPQVSRMTLTKDGQLSEHNSYLNDNVD